MKQKSWHFNRRDMLKASGITLSLPFLEAMAWDKSKKNNSAKRMVITYFSYGAYMPNGTRGIQDMKKPHHEWSWWPCKNAGPLTFNKNQAPFKSL